MSPVKVTSVMLAPERDLHRSQNFYATVVPTGKDLINEERAATM